MRRPLATRELMRLLTLFFTHSHSFFSFHFVYIIYIIFSHLEHDSEKNEIEDE